MAFVDTAPVILACFNNKNGYKLLIIIINYKLHYT